MHSKTKTNTEPPQTMGNTLNNIYYYIISKEPDRCIYFFYNVLMKTKNKKVLRIEPLGTSAFIKFQSDVAPGRTIRCFLSLR